jgi:predicted P-loop ATPase/GTPase
MKSIYIIAPFLLCSLISTSIFAQTYIPPDKDQEVVSTAMVLIKNNGQVIDNTHTVRNDVLYYIPNSTPAVYCMEDRVSLVRLILDDSINRDSIPMDSILNDSADLYRLDMQFLVEILTSKLFYQFT